MNYEALCRGENVNSSIDRPELKCHLVYKSGSFGYAPSKEEILWTEPLIMMYHDVISDEEIEHFKRTAGPTVCSMRVPKFVII